MSELWAQFERRHASGATVSAELRQPSTGFSVTVLLGPSGCGKTTVLRCLAGLERPESGFIHWEGEVWFDAARRVARSPQQRGVGFLFQEYALFPHLTVAENIEFGLHDLPVAARRARVGQLMRAFAVSELARRRPRQISGGQQQRVALARTLAVRPRLLLLDEPLTSLDPPLREQMRRELRELLREFQVPTLLVTHDRLEAMSLGDRVLVMDQGSVRQAGTVLDVFSKPVDATVAKMVGIETVVPATVVRSHDGLIVLRIGAVEVTAVAPRDVAPNVMACIRAEEVVLEKSAATGTSMRNQLPGRITSLTPEGPLVRVGIDCGFALTALVTRPAARELSLATGDNVWVGIKAPAIHLFAR